MSDFISPPKRDFYAIITNAGGDKVLLLEENNHWLLPHWEAQQAFDPGAITPWIINTLRELYGLETMVLKEYYSQRIFENNQFRGTHRVIALELREANFSVGQANWVGLENIAGASQKFVFPLHGELVEKWLLENTAGQIPPERAPWARVGWFERARAWATNFVEAQGWQLTGPVEQLRANIISAQLLIPTSAGNLYLKALPPYCKNEAVFGLVLEKILPGKVPHILQSEVDEGWILMSEFRGESLAGIEDFSVWETAMREYARLQIACAEHSQELLQAGARDRQLFRLASLLEEVLRRDDLWLVGESTGLSQEELSQLQAAIPPLQAMCFELATFGLPATIDSSDFHANNVALAQDGFIFYDWSELVITHPFVSLNPFMNYVKDKPDYWERLVQAYLEPWRVYLPQPELEHAYRLAFVLGSAIQVLNYAWIHDNIEPEDYRGIDFSLVYYAKKILEELGKGW